MRRRRQRSMPTAKYPPDTLLTIQQLAKALGVSKATIERDDLPTIYLGKRTRRYCWGQVMEALKGRAA